MVPNSDENRRAVLFSAFLDCTPEAIVFLDPDRHARYWSQAAPRLLEVASIEFANHPAIEQLFQRPQQDANGGSVDSNLAVCAATSRDYRLPSGETATIILVQHELTIDQQKWTMVTLAYPETGCTQASELYRLAHTDDLTQLLNRRGFQSALESNLNRPFALAMIDVDFFKRINDEHGHDAGDNAIILIARQIRQQFPQAMGLGRLGGDEFGVIIEWETDSRIQHQFQKFCDEVAANQIDWHPAGMTISIGVAVAKSTSSLARNVLTTADRAMYHSKSSGRNQVTVVDVDEHL